MDCEDEYSGHSLAAFISGRAIQTAINRVPPDIWQQTLSDLNLLVRPTQLDFKLRSILWRKLELAFETKKPIKLASVYEGLCTYTHFYNNILNVPLKLVWLLNAPPKFGSEMELYLPIIMSKVWEILESPLVDREGNFDMRRAEMVFRIWTFCHDRKFGNGKMTV